MKILPSCVIIDFDQTLTLNPSRDAMSKCLPNFAVIDVVRGLDEMGHKAVIMSTRKESERQDIKDWLNKYSMPVELLLLRAEDSEIADDKLKKKMFKESVKDKYRILCVLASRDMIVSMFRNDFNLQVHQIDWGAW